MPQATTFKIRVAAAVLVLGGIADYLVVQVGQSGAERSTLR